MNATNQTVKRSIKVATAFKTKGNNFNKNFSITSKIILQGDYLQKANFYPADKIEVFLGNGIIILKKRNLIHIQ